MTTSNMAPCLIFNNTNCCTPNDCVLRWWSSFKIKKRARRYDNNQAIEREFSSNKMRTSTTTTTTSRLTTRSYQIYHKFLNLSPLLFISISVLLLLSQTNLTRPALASSQAGVESTSRYSATNETSATSANTSITSTTTTTSNTITSSSGDTIQLQNNKQQVSNNINRPRTPLHRLGKVSTDDERQREQQQQQVVALASVQRMLMIFMIIVGNVMRGDLCEIANEKEQNNLDLVSIFISFEWFEWGKEE